MANEPVDERTLALLKWRCRRGLLENDLLIERFFARHAQAITPALAAALMQLMDLADADLLDLLLGREQPEGALDTKAIHSLLALMRARPEPAG